jgi:hypothetical protein
METPAPKFEPAEESAPAAQNSVSESTGDSAVAPGQNLNENDADEHSAEPKPKVEN